MSDSEQLAKRMLIDARSSTTGNDSAKFYDLMWLSIMVSNLNFHNTDHYFMPSMQQE